MSKEYFISHVPRKRKKTLIYPTTAELRYLPLQSTDRELSVMHMICLIPDSKSPHISYFKACLVVSLYSFFFNRLVGSNFQLMKFEKVFSWVKMKPSTQKCHCLITLNGTSVSFFFLQTVRGCLRSASLIMPLWKKN